MKKIYLNLAIAINSLKNFKLRTSLAILGVFLGTLSLIIVANLTKSMKEKTNIEISSLGENLLIVSSGIVRKFGAHARLLSTAITLTPEDATAILRHAPYVKAVTPLGNKTFPVRYKKTVLFNILISGVTPNFTHVRNFYPNIGTFFTEEDVTDQKMVAVIGAKVAEKLFGSDNPIGKHILLWRMPVQVIGVMERKGADISGADQDEQIFVPISTFMYRLVNRNYINSIYVQTVNEASLHQANQDIVSILRIRHSIKGEKKDDFSVIDMKDILSLKTQTMDMITALGNISAVVSFLIGGIGIFSIMILIINERKTEIGLRRAIGAKKKEIILQFLVESSLIALSGGTIGMVAGLSVTLMIFKATDLPFAIATSGLFFSFFASILVGIAAGIYPSKKAISIQPIDIIRNN